ncbi:anti-sigma factor [Sphingomonas oryzagri]|uniref:Anti-sigma factor n=1 Tax=Sphingomonas oryzagri TaxID=3042314 RepID=A0ABT6N3K9_9SPHN|nr:anti-sigma factor [Sphingomonas oryzagri]MDH7639349.1 anti-sigma factor [Sphingomonas oryzagri]
MSAELSDDDELLAAELAFGLIDGGERGAAEDRLGRDAGFADAHARWQAYAAAMASDPGEAPRPSVWSAIEARLPANDVAPARASRTSLRWWQAGTLAASAAAIVLGVVALQKPQTIVVRVPVAQPASAPMVAVLTGKKGIVTVSFDPASGRMTSAANGLDLGDHSPQLWVIPADGKPRSMGVMNASAPGWAKVPETASSVMAAGVTLAVSVEPVGGSPTGQPTGPVILTGKLTTT